MDKGEIMSTIKETTLHPDGNEGVDLYPKTNINQVQELPQKLTSVENQINQLNIGKLTKPTNPSAESAVTMLADGTVGTKPLSEIGGGKLYRHHINGSLVTLEGEVARLSIGVDIIKTSATLMNEAEFQTYVNTVTVASISGMTARGTVSIYSVPDTNQYGVYGAVFNPQNTEAANYVFSTFTFNSFTDTVTEL